MTSIEELFPTLERVVVFTGAGVSAESGISTFRAPDGIWARFNPQELANLSAFMANPERVWQWYEYRRSVVNDAKPNAAHYAIADLERIVSRVDVITQNVDGLHRRAGSTIVHELHGSLLEHRCLECGLAYDLNEEERDVPHCKTCGGLIRPGVVWFGEELPIETWDRAEQATRDCELFLSIGTSTQVYPAASLPFLALQLGKVVLEINPERTDLSHRADCSIQEPAAKAMPELLNQIRAAKKTLH